MRSLVVVTLSVLVACQAAEPTPQNTFVRLSHRFVLDVDPANGTVTVRALDASSTRALHTPAAVVQDGDPSGNPPETFQLVTTAARLPGQGTCPGTSNCFDVRIDSFLSRDAREVTLLVERTSPARTLNNGDSPPPGSGLRSQYGLRRFGDIAAGASSTRELRFTAPNLQPYVVVMSLWESDPTPAPDAGFADASAPDASARDGGAPDAGFAADAATPDATTPFDGSTAPWSPTTTTDAPSARMSHTAVWTGSEMIIWGGMTINPTVFLGDGAAYDPSSNSWRAISTVGAPGARVGHASVWTGSEMIIWAGYLANRVDFASDGALYNPSTNTWRPMTLTNAPSRRSQPLAVWTGTELIVWDGAANGTPAANGGRYNPTTNTWSAMASGGGPGERGLATAVWTGSEMIVWGGFDSSGVVTRTGAAYDPATNSWRTLAVPSGLNARGAHTAVWTGTRMIVWGGTDGVLQGLVSGMFNDGASYDPATNTWAPISSAGAPSARYVHRATLLGDRMVVWGSGYPEGGANSGGIYNVTTNTWSQLPPPGPEPIGTNEETLLTAGNAAIVWGGEYLRNGTTQRGWVLP